MRTIIAVLCLVVGMLAGYSMRPVPAHAQASDWLPFNAGETVRLHVTLPESVITCKVTQVRFEFVGCAERESSPPRWVNFRVINEITPFRER